MTDEAYTLSQANAERKRNSYGAYHKKGGSKSRRCSLPSDHMTEAE